VNHEKQETDDTLIIILIPSVGKNM